MRVCVALFVAVCAAVADDRDQAVRHTVSEYVLARELHREPAAMAAFFAPDAEMRNLDGSVTRGRATIQGSFARVFSDASARNLRGHTRIEGVKFIDKDVALVTLTNEWFASGNTSAGKTMTSL